MSRPPLPSGRPSYTMEPGSSLSSSSSIGAGAVAERILREERRRRASSDGDLTESVQRSLPPKPHGSRRRTKSIVSGAREREGSGAEKRKEKEYEETGLKVVIRVRPIIEEDVTSTAIGTLDKCVEVHDETICLSRPTYDEREFQFDNILDEDSQQDDMYNMVARDIVSDVLRGYNGTVLAYGQTGTGKTYTIFGTRPEWSPLREEKKRPGGDFPLSPSTLEESFQNCFEEDGAIPRTVAHVFRHVAEHSHDTEFRITVSFLQIYMESIMDLLDTRKQNLVIREDPKQGIFVERLTHVVVDSFQDVMELIGAGAMNRAITCTNMNKVSSRSHVILLVTVEQKAYEEEGRSEGEEGKPPSKEDQRAKRGTLTVVDLAGSERVAKSLSEGKRLEEAKKINKSLSALGNCVAALIDSRSTHVPFRDSKLTRLLTDSLGGNSKTCLCANIGPSLAHYEETFSTLLFATRAMAVKNHAVINEVVDFKSLTGSLQRKISLMESEKTRLMAHAAGLENLVASLRDEVSTLRRHGPSPSVGERGGTLPVSDMEGVDVSGMEYQPSSSRKHLSEEGRVAERTGGHFPPSAAFTLPPAASRYPGLSEVQAKHWEERERELVAKFTNIIQHLQMEIAKQNYVQTRRVEESDGDAILDELVSSIVRIPSLRKRLLEKLGIDPSLIDESKIGKGDRGVHRPKHIEVETEDDSSQSPDEDDDVDDDDVDDDNDDDDELGDDVDDDPF
eukprot:TRINITY_DN8181_c1_g2_i1.p1 TRINITY_DN8181_c1_g2~~TRINITY_DN8181_c1_g2_i1.p1  ORF type:complete len:733 (+),score=260.59 TRINITY_DN8181_c1_g2_i1:73-2271(+)